MLHIGCSGWSYDEWKGVLYPKGRVDKLRYYSAHFNTVEINSTFYSIPSESMVEGWISKTADRKNFLFSVKAPRDLSHDMVLRDPEGSGSYLDAFQSAVLYPILDAGRLGCVLMQLPPFFRLSHIDLMEKMFRNVNHEDFMYFVEFRNSDFYGNPIIRSKLEREGIGVVEVDSPDWHLNPGSSEMKASYIRFHGYNTGGWRNPSAGKIERYDYLYSREEIENFASLIKGKMENFQDVFIYFNNHPSGKAARNALDLAGILDRNLNTDQKFLY